MTEGSCRGSPAHARGEAACSFPVIQLLQRLVIDEDGKDDKNSKDVEDTGSVGGSTSAAPTTRTVTRVDELPQRLDDDKSPSDSSQISGDLYRLTR